MSNHTVSRLLNTTALIAILAAASGCTQVENAYHSAYQSVMGDDKEYKDSKTKVEVKTPAAAPIQDVKEAEITQPAAAPALTTPPMSDTKPVELGAAHDNSLDSAPATQSAATPVAEAPAVKEAPKTAATTAPTANNAGSLPLLTVRFNQPHVYYDDALGKAVSEAEKAKPGVTYDVLSTVPDLSSLAPDQQTKLAGRAKDNLRNVVMKMQQLGVSADRIRIADQTLKIRSQEIQIYVK